jgi:hypothetical protein
VAGFRLKGIGSLPVIKKAAMIGGHGEGLKGPEFGLTNIWIDKHCQVKLNGLT